MNCAILYFSPHGSTRKILDAVSKGISDAGFNTVMFNSGEYIKTGRQEELYSILSEYSLLITGTPVYAHHIPPLFEEFLSGLPPVEKEKSAAMVCTYGDISSGVALSQLAGLMDKKSYRLMGGMKAVSEHCLTFQGGAPIGSGRPDSEDIKIAQQFGSLIAERMKKNDLKSFKQSDFRDKSLLIRVLDATVFNMKTTVKMMPQIKVSSSLCAKCNTCADSCIAGNITVDDFPKFSDNCISCFRCVRVCPNNALTAPLAQGENFLHNLRKKLSKYENGETSILV